MTVKKYDAVIIGAGPAGCAAALKLAGEGLNVIILEKKTLPRVKVCAGLLPEAAINVLEEYLNLKIPETVFEHPSTVGLVYIPPSGVKNAVLKLNYKLYNINRAVFDNWLASEAGNKGVRIFQNMRPERIIFKDNRIMLKTSSGVIFNTGYLIGCDGVKSWVRRQLLNKDPPTAPVYQEAYSLKKEYDGFVKPYFYIFLNSRVCNLYSYIIIKGGSVILGVGDFNNGRNSKEIISKMINFKKLLTAEIPVFKKLLESKPLRQLWFIPFFPPQIGARNILLAGDAAGFVNSFSGEGVRLAVESGFYAGEAVKKSIEKGVEVLEYYRKQVQQLIDFCNNMRDYTISLTEEKRESYVKELKNVVKAEL